MATEEEDRASQAHRDAADALQREIYRRMTPEQKLNVVFQLRRHAWELKAAWTRGQHPDWSEAEVQESVRKVFLYART